MIGMRLEIRLLGTPTVLLEGAAVPPPRGVKPWALLAYLLLSPTAGSRVRLASMLFSDADDPLAALRWNLNAVRRLIGRPESFRGDPVDPRLPDQTWVDVHVLRSGSWPEALEIAGLGRELLEGLSLGGSPGFEAWLTAERRRVAADSGSALREAALARLAGGDSVTAAELAGRLVGMDPLDEAAHELLVRSLMAGGQGAAARAHLERASQLIRNELGVEPGPELLSACDVPPEAARAPEAVSVRAAIDAGVASVFAGQASGLQTLRRAVADARAIGDPELLLKALLVYGMALGSTDSADGEDDAAGMHEAIALAERHASPRQAARAHRQLAFGEYWRGHYDRAEAWGRSASELAAGDPAELPRVWLLRGCILTETARYSEAVSTLEDALDMIDDVRQPHDAAFALGMLGRAHLLRGTLAAAESNLERSLVLSRAQWSIFVPWTEAFRAEVAFRRGEVAEAATMFEHAYAMACHHYRSHRCQSLSARGLGLINATKGDLDAAVRWLDIARTRGPRSFGMHVWFRAFALEALCGVAVENHLPGAHAWIAALEALAGRHGMRDLLARALLHRGRLGDAEAMSASRSLAADIDSSALHELVGSSNP